MRTPGFGRQALELDERRVADRLRRCRRSARRRGGSPDAGQTWSPVRILPPRPRLRAPDTARGTALARRRRRWSMRGPARDRARPHARGDRLRGRRTRRPRRRRAAPRRTPRPPRRPRRSSGSSSTEATIRSHSSQRAPPPETRPRSRAHAELAQQVERVAQPVGDALEHRAHERAAVVAQRQAGERAARVGVGVRRALAGEVGQEREPLGARAPSAAAAATSVVEAAPGAAVSRSHGQRARGGEHHAHRVPAARDGVAERVDARALGRRANARQRGEDDARGARARPRAAPAGRRPRRARRRPGRPRPPRPGSPSRGLARDLGRLEQRAAATRGRARARRAPRRSSAGAATSSSSVPDASATSIACSPQSRRRT